MRNDPTVARIGKTWSVGGEFMWRTVRVLINPVGAF
jgi:hypothetical protein